MKNMTTDRPGLVKQGVRSGMICMTDKRVEMGKFSELDEEDLERMQKEGSLAGSIKES